MGGLLGAVLFCLVGIPFRVVSVDCKFVCAEGGIFWLWGIGVLYCEGLWCGISVVLVVLALVLVSYILGLTSGLLGAVPCCMPPLQS